MIFLRVSVLRNLLICLCRRPAELLALVSSVHTVSRVSGLQTSGGTAHFVWRRQCHPLWIDHRDKMADLVGMTQCQDFLQFQVSCFFVLVNDQPPPCCLDKRLQTTFVVFLSTFLNYPCTFWQWIATNRTIVKKIKPGFSVLTSSHDTRISTPL